jgi:DNA-binding MarR family transcriptional regulator
LNNTEAELIILENLYAQDRENISLKQRDLALLARTSLGMTNLILKRMVQKGWITARKLNSRNIRYAVTLDGINEIVHRGYHYLKRTISNVAHYRDAINEIVKKAVDKKKKSILLIGNSELEFIFEYTCNYYGLSFLNSAENEILKSVDSNTFIIYSEDIPYSPRLDNDNSVFISRILINPQTILAKITK